MDESKDFQEQIGRIDGLVRRLESATDPALINAARDLMGALMQLHGAALDRIFEVIEAGEGGSGLVAKLAQDPLVGSLLVLYGLHPEDFDARVQRAFDQARALCRKDGARLEECSIEGTIVRLRVAGGGSRGLENAIREAILEAAPDATEINIAGLELAGAAGFVPLASIGSAVQS